MRARIRPIAAILASALTLNATPGTTLFSDYANSLGDTVSVEESMPAESFSTGASAYTLTSVTLKLSNSDEAVATAAGLPDAARTKQRHAGSKSRGFKPRGVGGFVTVNLYTDNNTDPGTLITQLGSALFDTSLGSAPADYTFSCTAGSLCSLAANTRYWIVVTPGNDTIAEWWYTRDPSGSLPANVDSEFNEDTGRINVNADNGEPYIMEVFATVGSLPTTPVPPSLTLVLTGLLCVGLYFTRRRLART